MSDDLPEPSDPAAETSAEGLSRKERNAARRAEFEAMKAAKDSGKTAAKDAKAAERAAAKEAKEALLAEAKATKDAALAAKKAAKKAAAQAKAEAKAAGKPVKETKVKEKKEKPAKPEKAPKDPYRPRYATAPSTVRTFAVLAGAFAAVYVVLAALLLLETTGSPLFDVLPEDAAVVAYLVAFFLLLVAVLWVATAVLLCGGRLLGRHLWVVAMVLGLPFSLVTAFLLFSRDVRDWAL